MTSYLASVKRYGAPKFHKDLLAKGYRVSIKRVQKLMKTLTIHSIVRKKYRPVLSTKKEVKEYPNLLKRDFLTDKVNEKWVIDITYIYTLSDGWCYLSSILGLHSRKIISWRLSKKMETPLVIETLKDTLSTRSVRDELILLQTEGVNIRVKNTMISYRNMTFNISTVPKVVHIIIVALNPFMLQSKKSASMLKLMSVTKIIDLVTQVFSSTLKDFIIREDVTTN